VDESTKKEILLMALEEFLAYVFEVLWIPGGLQLQCIRGYYDCWGNFVPPIGLRI